MIKVKNLSKVYDKRGIAGLHEVSFELKEGQIAALMGPNGSGKTSLLNSILGKLPIEKGSISAEGEVACFDPATAPESGNVQKFLVSSISLSIDDEKKIQLTRDLADVLEFTFQLRQDLKDLSAGQKQKVLLASILINRPSILLLDEPFTHLDPMTRKGILESLFQYIKNQNISLLWVTHDLEEACQYSDVIGILNFGKLEQWGRPAEITFKPKNLFVAEFVGYKNILAISHQNGKWQTPWGERDFTHHEHVQEALLVIPHASWEVDPEQRFTLHYRGSYPQGQRWLVEVEAQDKRYTLSLSQKVYEDLGTKTSFHMRPIWQDCFLLSL
jgi:ABC-type sugar transport system ATPase subunit